MRTETGPLAAKTQIAAGQGHPRLRTHTAEAAGSIPAAPTSEFPQGQEPVPGALTCSIFSGVPRPPGRIRAQNCGRGQFSISPQATNQWKEQVPLRSQARRGQPGQAHSRVPTVACTRWMCSRQSRPWSTRAPQDLQGFDGQTHSFGMATGSHGRGSAAPNSPLLAPAPNKDRYGPTHR